METDEPNDVELLNTLLAFSVKGYSGIDVSTAGDLADVKSGMATTAADLGRTQRSTRPIMVVLLVAIIAATVLVIKGRGTDAADETFDEPGSDEAQSTA